jgi:hypothetical protein
MRIAAFSTVFVACLCCVPHVSADNLIISEIVDGTLPGGQPKFVELTNTGSTAIDLGMYSIGNYNNGGTDLGGDASTLLSGSLTAADSFVIAYESAPAAPEVSVFESTYGFPPDLFLGPFINGDDVIALFEGQATGDGSDATIIDLYGVIGVDGTGEAWEYMDGYSFRNPDVISASSTFVLSEWTFGGPDSLDGVDDAERISLMNELTTPGTHQFVPEPNSATLALFGILLLGFLRRSR